MVYRPLRISFWLIGLFAIFVIWSSAGPAVLADGQRAFRIVTTDVSDIVTQDVTPEIARALHMSQPHGVLISDVRYGPLRRGDVILSINGNRVRCQTELYEQLAEVSFGRPFFVEVFRDGGTQTVRVRRAIQAAPSPVLRELGTAGIRGIRVASLSTEDGVMVEEVQIGTPASDAGLTSGDIILEVDGHPVHSAGEFLGFMRQLNNRHAIFAVLHTNCQIDVFVIPA